MKNQFFGRIVSMALCAALTIAAVGVPGSVKAAEKAVVSEETAAVQELPQFEEVMEPIALDPELGLAVAAAAVNLSTPTISNVRKEAAGKLIISWSLVRNATGYQIQYSYTSSFASTTSVNIPDGGTTTRSISNLKQNKRVYLRIRAKRTANGTTTYSSWSRIGSVTV